ncbi:hypothetical protein NDU88_002867 [Pleurodeles waltl]|uniref:Uncharacterized protein n=1 Tax=Pleurodeles waltl TaxID=8319 RepID=A0AAV7T4H8_PLEWA|nr:hypothetical protein NDU88_002867 [Pleurodeles waltl]
MFPVAQPGANRKDQRHRDAAQASTQGLRWQDQGEAGSERSKEEKRHLEPRKEETPMRLQRAACQEIQEGHRRETGIDGRTPASGHTSQPGPEEGRG